MVEIPKETLDAVKKQRLEFMETQIADARINVAVYTAVYDFYNNPEDKQKLDQSYIELNRLYTAFKAIQGVE